ncbi:MAG TPA: diguanylate cyclase [Candidatus Heimdallarchaeota archaeon]|nr:diguanylate cyclase [Candidatus Heimdallarchaeota archaeon]
MKFFNKLRTTESINNHKIPPKINILILNNNPQETDYISDLCSTSGVVQRASDIPRAISHLESRDFNVLVVDQGLAHYSLLKGLFKHITSIIITGKSEEDLKGIASDWPPNHYTDHVLSPYQREGHREFLRALNTALEHSKLKIELQNLRHSSELGDIEMQEAFSQIKELKYFINDSIVIELEKRLEIETKYKLFLKEKSKIYDILKQLYIANDVTNLLDISHDIKDLVSAQSISIYILDENEISGRFLKPLVWNDHILSHPEIAKHTVLIDATDFAAHTVLSGRSIKSSDLISEKGFSKRYKEQLNFPLRSILSVPIKHDRDIIGVLEVYNKITRNNDKNRYFSLEDQEILQKISEHISIAITKLNLIQYDPLTGLLRPDPFIDKVIQKLNSESKRQQEDISYAMVMGDVDWFKNYNDKNGHEAGNNLLRELAQILKSSIREEDFLCRYGGEEFLFFLSNISSREEVLIITERIRKNVEKHYFEFQEFQPRKNLTMSFGITNFTRARFDPTDNIDKEDIKKITHEADLAMAESKGKETSDAGEGKEKGAEPEKNKICVYHKRSLDDTKVKDVIMPYAEIYAHERRKYQRYYTSTILIYKKDKNPQVSKTINLSLSGAKVSTAAELPHHELFDITLLLGNKALQTVGQVVYSRKESGNFPSFHSGIHFGDLTIIDRQVFEDYFTSLNVGKTS